MAKSEQKKALALSALMECDTFTEAAEKAGISRRTLYSYLSEDEAFARAHRAMQERRTLERAELVEQNFQRAMQTVVQLMEDQQNTPCAVRLKAALSLMELAQTEHERAGVLAQKNKDRTNPMSMEHMLEL